MQKIDNLNRTISSIPVLNVIATYCQQCQDAFLFTEGHSTEGMTWDNPLAMAMYAIELYF